MALTCGCTNKRAVCPEGLALERHVRSFEREAQRTGSLRHHQRLAQVLDRLGDHLAQALPRAA